MLPQHLDNSCISNGLVTLMPEFGVLYGFRITRIVFFLTGCQPGFLHPGLPDSRHECKSRFSHRYGPGVPAPPHLARLSKRAIRPYDGVFVPSFVDSLGNRYLNGIVNTFPLFPEECQ
jgi:hypothetical protein